MMKILNYILRKFIIKFEVSNSLLVVKCFENSVLIQKWLAKNFQTEQITRGSIKKYISSVL